MDLISSSSIARHALRLASIFLASASYLSWTSPSPDPTDERFAICAVSSAFASDSAAMRLLMSADSVVVPRASWAAPVDAALPEVASVLGAALPLRVPAPSGFCFAVAWVAKLFVTRLSVLGAAPAAGPMAMAAANIAVKILISTLLLHDYTIKTGLAQQVMAS
jgi:hypothetical protein